MPLPADAVPVESMQETPKGMPADAVPIGEDSGPAPIDMTNMFGSADQGTGGAAPQNESAAPINMGQAVNLGTIRTPEFKMKYLQQLFPNTPIALADDGRIQVGDTFIEPKRQGIINWFKDNATKLSEFVGEQGLPIAGQMGADAMAMMAAPETGGASMLGLGAANAAGAAAGTGARQAYANQLIGEPYSGTDAALQGVAGAASVPISNAVASVARKAVRVMGNGVGKIADAVGTSFPSIAESLFQVPHMNSEWLMSEMRAGRPAAEIINDQNLSPGRGGEIVRNLLFGDKNAKGVAEEFIPQYQRLIKPIAGDQAKVSTLDKFFSDGLKISQDTLDAMKKHSASELLDPSLTDPRAFRTLADSATKAIDNAQVELQKRYGGVLNNVIDKTKNHAINIADDMKELKNSLKEIRILSDDGDYINGSYTGQAAKKAYGTILGKFDEIFSNTKGYTTQDLKYLAKKQGQKLTEGTGRSTAQKQMLEPFALDKMRVSDIRNFKSEIQPLFDRAFEGTGLSQEEKRPLAIFLSKLDKKLESLPGAGPLKEMNAKYANFQEAKSFFSSINQGTREEQEAVIGRLRQGLSSNDSTRETMQSYISDLDNQIGKNKILPRLKMLGASQEARFADYGTSTEKMVRELRSLHQAGMGQDVQRLTAEGLKEVDNSIKQRSYKFYNDMRDHLTAEAFGSNKQNIFKVRAIETLLGAQFLTSGHPVLGSAGVLLGLSHFSPKGIGEKIVGLDNLGRGLGGSIDSGAHNISARLSSPQARALLASLIRKKTGL